MISEIWMLSLFLDYDKVSITVYDRFSVFGLFRK